MKSKQVKMFLLGFATGILTMVVLNLIENIVVKIALITNG